MKKDRKAFLKKMLQEAEEAGVKFASLKWLPFRSSVKCACIASCSLRFGNRLVDLPLLDQE